jgi:CheY-like chemotaxis protein
MNHLNILLVEDSPLQLDAIALAIEGLGLKQCQGENIASLKISKANCGADARRLLEKAVLSKNPFDLLLLDLSLPEHHGGSDNQKLGFELLDYATQQKAALGVVVISAFDDLGQFVAPAFQHGAIEFIAKPYGREELQQRVLNAWKLIVERRCRELVEERIKEDTFLYLEEGVIYRYQSCFSQLVQAVVYEADEFGAVLQSELSIDFVAQPNHQLALRLKKFGEIAAEAQRDWNALQASFKYDQQVAEEIDLAKEIRQLERDLHPCIAIELEEVFEPARLVLSFQKNVRSVLKELLIGGLSVANAQREWHVKVGLRWDDGFAIVEFEDDFPTLNPATTDLINRGEAIAAKLEDWRAWGLSVAQHLALRGGGRIEVNSRSNTEGNLITYLIPVA